MKPAKRNGIQLFEHTKSTDWVDGTELKSR